MKRVFGMSLSGKIYFSCFSHGGLFYVRQCKNLEKSYDHKDPSNRLVLKLDNEMVCRAYCDGYIEGLEHA